MILREVSPKEAIGHALWEADACMKQWAFCAALSMLRKALDLWSTDYAQRTAMAFDQASGERDSLYWRLKKVADQNPLYRDHVHAIIDGLRLTANDALHEATACVGGTSGTFDGGAIVMIEGPPRALHAAVVNLITMSMPGIRVVYAGSRRL